MKIYIIALLLLSSSQSFAGQCKGNVYSRADNGEFAFERVHFVITSTPKDKFVLKKDGHSFHAEFTKSDDWTYYSYIDQNDMLRTRGYRSSENDFRYSEMRSKESFFKFKDIAIVGFNLICRM
jgi:hypothetical protein